MLKPLSWMPHCLLCFQCKFYFSQSSATHLVEPFLHNSHHFILKYFVVDVKYDSQKFLLGYQNFSFIPALLSSVPYQNRLNNLSFITVILLLCLGMAEPWILYIDNKNQINLFLSANLAKNRIPTKLQIYMELSGRRSI